METVKIGKVYRHFKGNYYFVENVAYDSETKERMVVYKPLYNREDGRQIWIRPEKMFLEEIPERPDNVTGQKFRFEIAEDRKYFLYKEVLPISLNEKIGYDEYKEFVYTSQELEIKDNSNIYKVNEKNIYCF